MQKNQNNFIAQTARVRVARQPDASAAAATAEQDGEQDELQWPVLAGWVVGHRDTGT